MFLPVEVRFYDRDNYLFGPLYQVRNELEARWLVRRMLRRGTRTKGYTRKRHRPVCAVIDVYFGKRAPGLANIELSLLKVVCRRNDNSLEQVIYSQSDEALFQVGQAWKSEEPGNTYKIKPVA